MANYQLRSLPQVTKIEILYSGPVVVLEKLKAILPPDKCGTIGDSAVPGFDRSMFIYAHSLELEKNLKTHLDKLILENPGTEEAPVVLPVVPPKPAGKSRPIYYVAAILCLTLLTAGGFVYFSDSNTGSARDKSSLTNTAGKKPAKAKKKTKTQKNSGDPNSPKVLAQYIAPEQPKAARAAARVGTMTLHMVDVRQGDAILIYFPSGKNMLIDGGEPKGKQNLLKFLSGKNIERIDFVVVTHPHLDHMAALNEILDKYEVGQFIDPAYPHATRSYQKILEKVQDKGVPYVQARAGMSIDVGVGTEVRILSPPESFLENTRSDVNNASVVLRIQHGENSFLFTGDIEAEIEDVLTGLGNVRATILKAPHHGGAHSSQSEFLEEVSPEYVLISCGEGNSYGHPAPSSLMRYKKIGAKVYRTDRIGTITVISDGKTIHIQTQNGGDPA